MLAIESSILPESSWSTSYGGLLYIVVSAAAHLTTPRADSLTTTTLSAVLLWAFTSWQYRKSSSSKRVSSRGQAILIGFLLALAQASQSAVRKGQGIWWPQALVPAALTCLKIIFRSLTTADGSIRFAQGAILLLSTFLALYALDLELFTLSETILGVTSAGSQAAAFLLLDNQAETLLPLPVFEKTGELLGDISSDDGTSSSSSVQDACASFAACAGLGAWIFESPQQLLDFTALQQVALAGLLGAASLYLTFALTARYGARVLASLSLACSLATNMLLSSSWLASCIGVVAATGLPQLHASEPVSNVSWRRPSRFLVWAALVAISTLFVAFSTLTSSSTGSVYGIGSLPGLKYGASSMQVPNSIHPIKYLVSTAESQWSHFTTSQSKSLKEAVLNYKTRYGISPPPGFDRWYEFARSNGVENYDNYDIIFNSLQPFWALKPMNIRSRVQEAIGFERNALIVLMVRNGRISKLTGGLPWQREALSGMMSSFVEMLPDLDLAFNAHDEPRVIIPHGELSSMINQARDGPLARAREGRDLKNKFSSRPQDMSDGLSIREYKASRFNEFAHQNTWGPSRLSCSPESPARAVNEDLPDSAQSYELGSLGFIYNTTASTDICQIPSLRGTHAFFDRPNAFNVAHDLVPVFSESKISSFQDIVFPSMWHWYEKIYVNRTEDMHLASAPTYDPSQDLPWEDKKEDLYWRGSTTGGWSEDGGWRRHHRQRLVQLLNSAGQASVLKQTSPTANTSDNSLWLPQTIKRSALAHLINVSFTGVGQCAEHDCAAQREFFDIAPHAPLHTAWTHKHLLDMDGNAFSARFYALLRSNSLVYKAALFREWHDEILHPWLHYIPLSLSGRDALEAVRYFAQEPEGMRAAEKLALTQQKAARSLLRRVDMESWMFRLLLEYARVVDDERERIGYS